MKNLFISILLLLLPLGTVAQAITPADSWEDVLRNKSGSITVTWYSFRPFIYKDERNNLAGIEYEILTGFQQYLKETHGVTLTIEWWENTGFLETYRTIQNSRLSGIIGISAFSITPKRQKEVTFAPPYMSDIAVLISSYDVPIVKNTQEFATVFNRLKAITIKGTTYAEDLETLKRQYDLEFEIEYIPSSQDVQAIIEQTTGTFGFIDLPIYLTSYSRNSSGRVKRQNLFPMKRIGYSVIIPTGSDWGAPLEEYILSRSFQESRDEIIGKYLDRDLYDFIRGLYSAANEDIILLTKEKEIQNEVLISKTEQIKREAMFRNFLIAGVVVVLIFLAIISRLYVIRHRTALLLQQQTEKIDSQRRDIEAQKVILEQHNKRLIELNEEKNHLIGILAHDLRSPLTQITGFTFLLKMEKHLSDNQVDLINKIQEGSVRMTNMIARILDIDSIERDQPVLKLEPVAIAGFTEEIVTRFKPEAEKKGIDLLFSTTGSPFVEADPVHLTQVIENLISNALKFSDKGKEVKVEVHGTKEFVEIRISDQGPGFTEEDKKLIFRKFQRLSAQPTGFETSTGLGLSIVKKYAELMNATIQLESEFGQGSTFKIKFKNS